MAPKRKRGSAAGGWRTNVNEGKAAYIDIRIRLERRPAGKKSNAAARKYYESQYNAVEKRLPVEQRDEARTQEVQRLRDLDAAGQGDTQDGNDDADDGDDVDVGPKAMTKGAKKDTKRPTKRVKIADAAEDEQDEDGGEEEGPAKSPMNGKGKEATGAQVATKAAKPKKPAAPSAKSKGKKKAATDDGGDDAAATHLVDDVGDGEVPAADDGKGAGGRPKSARLIAKEAEEAFGNDPEGVTKGGDVVNIDTGKKTAAGGDIPGRVYPPFGPADGRLEKGWEDQGTHLGTGGQGCLFLYRRYEDGAVVDRVVVKDSMLSGAEWSCFYKWHPDVSDLRKVPALHRLLSA